MAYRNMSLEKFIQEFKDDSKDDFRPQKFCFVIGAGASVTSGIPSGRQLVDKWDLEIREEFGDDEYNHWKESLHITEENKYEFYSHYYEKLYRRSPSKGYSFLEKLMSKAEPGSGYVMLAYILSKTNSNIVITTNFDHLIEDALNGYGQTMPLVIGHESLAYHVEQITGRPTVLKIHRNLLLNPMNSVDEVSTLHKDWANALSLIFIKL